MPKDGISGPIGKIRARWAFHPVKPARTGHGRRNTPIWHGTCLSFLYRGGIRLPAETTDRSRKMKNVYTDRAAWEAAMHKRAARVSIEDREDCAIAWAAWPDGREPGACIGDWDKATNVGVSMLVPPECRAKKSPK